MRVTNNMIMNRMMLNLNRNLQQMNKTMMQASTTKRIHLPSDDPVGITRSMKIRADINELQQYKKNVDDVVSFLETTELAIKGVGQVLLRLRDLTGKAANGVLTNDDMIKIKEEVSELKNQIISYGNTTYAGKYVFSGKKTDVQLFDENGNYKVDLTNMYNPADVDDKIQFEVGVNDKIEINSLGFEVFDNITTPAPGDKTVAAGTKAGLIQLIEEIEGYLDAENNQALTNALDDIDKYVDINLTARSQIGAKMNRMELVQNRIGDDIVNFTKLLSEIEDADLAEVYMNLTMQENVYQSSLAIGARIIQPSLLDFLR
ncbi:flagellar hook-associated protein FlgL [Alkaliphilus peptidifermentans]|uniref:Flagellar hook-associated protein 3 FlgL n=1 Tax=Alkaliphilus peptidifermentans DSM 18978 TaxID=1120976 RepID=A0A1G5JEW1_9FIRM|nr:flagellar hook-associated protein FlgL [Alkaliphilus peptidifermentans]SCY86886.1 flagellar hook-associated protein 3 FlgL [Alkaliphilus peptidifermentans DSM 18978]